MNQDTFNGKEYVSCSCEICKNACTQRPGWFIPEQVPAIEIYFGKKISELLGKELAIDWGTDMEMKENILLLAPNIENNQSIQYPANPRGKCVFLVEGKCSIYAVRPYECGVASHSDTEEKDILRHIEIAAKWKNCKILEDYKAKIICYQPTFNDLYGATAITLQDKYLNLLKKHQNHE
jgi:Fe-S-cluster containining protein